MTAEALGSLVLFAIVVYGALCLMTGLDVWEKPRRERRRRVMTVVLKIGGVNLKATEIVMGGDRKKPIWEEYVSQFIEEWQPKIQALREFIEANDLVGIKADQFCNDHYFEFEDNSRLGFTWRAWGDLMQAIVGKREGYMRYYM